MDSYHITLVAKRQVSGSVRYATWITLDPNNPVGRITKSRSYESEEEFKRSVNAALESYGPIDGLLPKLLRNETLEIIVPMTSRRAAILGWSA
jgi:hypothetical protein